MIRKIITGLVATALLFAFTIPAFGDSTLEESARAVVPGETWWVNRAIEMIDIMAPTLDENQDITGNWEWQDTYYIGFGDDADYTIRADANSLNIVPNTDDTGTIEIGSSTKAVDTKWFDTGSGYALFDAGNAKLTLSAVGINFAGTHTASVIDFTNVTIDHTGSNGPALLRAGTYASPWSNADEDQSGMLRLYMQTSADGSSYDRGVFVCLKTTGTKGIFPVAGLAEVLAQSGAGPNKAQAAQFITGLHESTSKLATMGGDSTAGMYGAWLKVYSVTGSVASSGSRVAAVWLDNQMSGTVSGEEYTIFSTTGGTVPDAWAAFETTSSGWASLFYFDETAYDQNPVFSSGTCKVDASKNSTGTLKINLNGTTYYIGYWAVADLTS